MGLLESLLQIPVVAAQKQEEERRLRRILEEIYGVKDLPPPPQRSFFGKLATGLTSESPELDALRARLAIAHMTLGEKLRAEREQETEQKKFEIFKEKELFKRSLPLSEAEKEHLLLQKEKEKELNKELQDLIYERQRKLKGIPPARTPMQEELDEATAEHKRALTIKTLRDAITGKFPISEKDLLYGLSDLRERATKSESEEPDEAIQARLETMNYVIRRMNAQLPPAYQWPEFEMKKITVNVPWGFDKVQRVIVPKEIQDVEYKEGQLIDPKTGEPVKFPWEQAWEEEEKKRKKEELRRMIFRSYLYGSPPEAR